MCWCITIRYIHEINIINITCKVINESVYYLPYLELVPTCFTNDLSINDDNTTLILSNNLDEFLHIEGFKSYGESIYYLPYFNNFDSLRMRYLSITNTKLKKISKTALGQLKNLNILDLSANEIESLDSNLFTENRYLQGIILTQNRINFVDLNSFNGLYDLEYLEILHNMCCSLKARTRAKILILANEIYNSCKGEPKALISSDDALANINTRIQHIEFMFLMYGVFIGTIMIVFLSIKCYKNYKLNQNSSDNHTSSLMIQKMFQKNTQGTDLVNNNCYSKVPEKKETKDNGSCGSYEEIIEENPIISEDNFTKEPDYESIKSSIADQLIKTFEDRSEEMKLTHRQISDENIYDTLQY